MAHRLSRIEITNFRSIKNHVFDLYDYTPLIGYNNAGKTNIVKAIKWLLRKASLAGDCFYDANQPIEVVGVIEGVTDELLNNLPANQKTALQSHVRGNSITVKRVQLRPNDSAAAIKMYIQNLNPSGEDDLWKINPLGIDQALASLFPDPIHIGAMENAEEDVSKSKSSSTIGKLLAEIVAPIEEQHGARVKDALNLFHTLLDAEGADRAPELTGFDEGMSSKIDDFFPDVKVRLHIPTPELKEVFSKGTLRVYEGESTSGRDVGSFGHGAQRSIQMALIRYLAEIKREVDNPKTRTLLLIDEPELYLHPQAIEIIKSALKKLSQEGYQVVFSTHSAMMLTHQDVGNALLIRKNKETGTYCRPTVHSAIASMELDAPSQLQTIFSISNSSNILFSERVFLTEGTTEERLMPIISSVVTGKSLGLHKCALVKLGGSGGTRKTLLVLQVMNIPSKAIVDLDYIFRQGVKDGYVRDDNEQVANCKEVMSRMASEHGIILGEDGWPNKRGRINAAQAFAKLAEHPDAAESIEILITLLRANNIWVWRNGTIENHLGIDGKDEAAWATYAQRLQTESLETVITDYDGVRQCIEWLVS